MEKEKIDYLLKYFIHLLQHEGSHNFEYPYLSLDEKKFEREKVAIILWEKHKNEIYLNNCPKCGKITRTPKAKQCRFCHHDWH